ncbi:MAG: hypothetical protein WC498_03375 [Candidatus Saccharimonadales bacterium]
MILRWRNVSFGGLITLAIICLLLLVPRTHAATPTDFSLQVTPSPLVTTVKPGQASQLELKIRNAGSQTEKLKVEPRSFTFDNSTGQVKLNDTTPANIAAWISFSKPTFTVQPGQWFTEEVGISLPKDTGFSYSFALVISRQSEPKPTQDGRLIKGSVAVFTLVNVDRPGATRQLRVTHFKTTHGIYEYLPAKLEVSFKNTGNTIVQPFGNVFIQRGDNARSPLATLPVNETNGYILPGTERTLTLSWSDGFPVYTATVQPDGSSKEALTWNWDKAKLSSFRIGHYTAKLVAVYNDGQRDVPMQGEVSFWVVPWRAFMLLVLVIGGLLYLQHWRIKRKTSKAVSRALEATKRQPEVKS